MCFHEISDVLQVLMTVVSLYPCFAKQFKPKAVVNPRFVEIKSWWKTYKSEAYNLAALKHCTFAWRGWIEVLNELLYMQ